jgi:hypothetical protein
VVKNSIVLMLLVLSMNEHQHHLIDYLMEENRVLREQIGNRRRLGEWLLNLSQHRTSSRPEERVRFREVVAGMIECPRHVPVALSSNSKLSPEAIFGHVHC